MSDNVVPCQVQVRPSLPVWRCLHKGQLVCRAQRAREESETAYSARCMSGRPSTSGGARTKSSLPADQSASKRAFLTGLKLAACDGAQLCNSVQGIVLAGSQCHEQLLALSL